MGLVNDAVFSKLAPSGLGIYRFDLISSHHKALLLSINKRQRRNFKRYSKIPRQVLTIWHDNGYLPLEIQCDHGISVKKILDLLPHGTYADQSHAEHGKWLYNLIVEECIMPARQLIHTKKRKGGSEKFIRTGKKFMSISHLREQPGTIIK